MRRLSAVLTVMMVLGTLAGCSGGGSVTYVSLGDSYVSGPGIDPADPQVPACLRSDSNYPSLIAQSMDVKRFVDVSCGGEDTTMLVNGRALSDGTFAGPELDALKEDTSLVTVGIGANDGQAYLGLFTHCMIPGTATDALCRAYTTSTLPSIFDATQRRVEAILAEVRKRSPEARIVLVGYLRLVPDTGSCPLLPLSEANRAAAFTAEEALSATLKKAASTAKVSFVDARKLSHGHDACAGDNAWVNGIQGVDGDGTLLHPKAAGMRAVADEVLKVIDD